MRTKEEIKVLRERAIELRLAGKSLREIKDILGPVGKRTLHAALKGTPPADWTRRPNAKDDLRDTGPRAARRRASSYNEIAAQPGRLEELGLPLGPRHPRARNGSPTRNAGNAQPTAFSVIGKLSALFAVNNEAAERAAATAEIGELTDREILIAGAIAYWCEGSKIEVVPSQQRQGDLHEQRPRADSVSSFVSWTSAGVAARSDLVFRVHIHEKCRRRSSSALLGRR